MISAPEGIFNRNYDDKGTNQHKHDQKFTNTLLISLYFFRKNCVNNGHSSQIAKQEVVSAPLMGSCTTSWSKSKLSLMLNPKCTFHVELLCE